jgi:5-oxoprolinase (ATP-hydrolysing)
MRNPDPPRSKWRFWIDRGGTFTDVIGLDPDDKLHSLKLLSDGGENYQEAAIEGIKVLLNTHDGTTLSRDHVSAIRMGTTVATNALLERKGVKVGCLVTAGFEDALVIGDQSRPKLFSLAISRSKPLYDCIFGVKERVSNEGDILIGFNEQSHVRQILQGWMESGVESIAICLLHSLSNPRHELMLAEIAGEIGFKHIYSSHTVSPSPRWVVRSNTTLLEAYLTPVLQRYIDSVDARIQSIPLHFMSSTGGLVSSRSFSGKDAILSGPAGGVIGAVEVAKSHGFSRCIGFDMGGTSADVFYWDGRYQRTEDTEIAGIKVQIPMLRVHTIASGGGSVISLEHGRLRVGPMSAGSRPGPACYGQGGPATLTDANLVLGRLNPKDLPCTFGQTGTEPLCIDHAFKALGELIGQYDHESIKGLAQDAIKIADEQMAQAIRQISIAEGHSLHDCPLIAFGGAGGQFACGVASSLGINHIVVHPLAGVLSAWGIGQAPFITLKQTHCHWRLQDIQMADLDLLFQSLECQAIQELKLELPDDLIISCERNLKIRVGQSETLFEVNYDSIELIEISILTMFKRRFGYRLEPSSELWIIQAQVVAKSELDRALRDQGDSNNVSAHGEEYKQGPYLVAERLGTVFVASNWEGYTSDTGRLMLKRIKDSNTSRLSADEEERSAALVELFHNRFMSIAKEMGTALQQSAQSVNIRERLDYSCAIFSESGELVAHAPHIPVHLGSMGAAVRAVISQWAHLADHDMVVINSPIMGGTHLPDITVVCRIGELAWLAARGHHTDIGGLTPGSMPAHSHTLMEEGVILDGFLLKNGRFLENDLRRRLIDHTYPARYVEQNINDLRAQVAALQHGRLALNRLIAQEGRKRIRSIMQVILKQGERALREKLPQLVPQSVINRLDDDQQIAVRVSVIDNIQSKHRSNKTKDQLSQPTLCFDFEGTSEVSLGNRNTPPSITSSAILYVLRLWLGDAVPLNEGVMRAVMIKLPSNSLLSPLPNSAVVAGNVETSQALVDTLLVALQLQAHGQGTMNNLTLGWKTGSYYETLCGGTGAGQNYHGCNAIHCHMTNSRLTDPEVFERNVPMLINHFFIRTESGGKGAWRGGEGVNRLLTAQETISISILSSRRVTRAQGLAGGKSGASGENRLKRKGDNEWTVLNGNISLTLQAGDQLCILTPGGGGYGQPTNTSQVKYL